MMKTITKIFAGLLCVGMLVGLCGCGMYTAPDFQDHREEQQAIREEEKAIEDAKQYQEDELFELVAVQYEDDGDAFTSEPKFIYYRETRTDVMYVRCDRKAGYAGIGGMTVMLHPDGTPLLYSEWVEMGK